MAKSPVSKRLKYGMLWDRGWEPIHIEIEAIRRGGRWKGRHGWYGEGISHHVKELQKIIWPEKDFHKWSDLLRENFCTHRFTSVIGPASTGKTHEAALFALCMYYAFPESTTVLCSSTEREMLEMRVWGEIKKHHKIAQSRFPWLPGNLIEGRQRIVTDSRSEAADGRDFRNGLCGVPCKRGGSFIGLGSFAGVKNKRVIMIADELQFMHKSFVDALSNMNKNPWCRVLAIGNVKEPYDALGLMAEPSKELGGWDGGIDQTGGTKTWPTRWPDGVCVQLVGSDSPNFEVGIEDPAPYPYLIDRRSYETDIAFYGKDSLQFLMMDEGRMPRGVGLRRIITRPMCERFHAVEQPVWSGKPRTRIAFMDAAYGGVGGDRCVFGTLDFGQGIDSAGREKQMIALNSTCLVPINAQIDVIPEDQIANWVKDYCNRDAIPPQNFFFDSTGRGTLMSAFARTWSPYVNGIEFGGRPTERYVSTDRRVLCCEHYSKFVTELWYSVRLCIEADQFRGLTEEVMLEGCMREWTIVASNKIEAEPKDRTKVRMGRSPDLFDALVAGVEGARRRGFNIGKLSNANASVGTDWILELKERYSPLDRKGQMQFVRR